MVHVLSVTLICGLVLESNVASLHHKNEDKILCELGRGKREHYQFLLSI